MSNVTGRANEVELTPRIDRVRAKEWLEREGFPHKYHVETVKLNFGNRVRYSVEFTDPELAEDHALLFKLSV